MPDKKIKKDTVIAPELITFKSPGTGIPSYMIEKVLGRTATKNIDNDTILNWRDMSKRPIRRFKGPTNWSRLQ